MSNEFKKKEKIIGLLEEKDRSTKKNRSSYFALLSLILGVVASLISILGQQTIDLDISNLDSSAEYKKQNNLLNSRISLLEIELDLIQKKVGKTDTLFVYSNVVSLDRRLKIIEKGISEDPERSLSILHVRQEIDLLKKADEYSKELFQSKINSISEKLEIQNAWILGILITIFGTVLSFVIPNLIPKNE